MASHRDRIQEVSSRGAPRRDTDDLQRSSLRSSLPGKTVGEKNSGLTLEMAKIYPTHFGLFLRLGSLCGDLFARRCGFQNSKGHRNAIRALKMAFRIFLVGVHLFYRSSRARICITGHPGRDLPYRSSRPRFALLVIQGDLRAWVLGRAVLLAYV